MNVLFERIRVLNPVQNLDGRYFLWLKDGHIEALSLERPVVDPDTIPIRGDALLAIPGLFDMHVHLREPGQEYNCLLYTSPSPRDRQKSRMPSSA